MKLFFLDFGKICFFNNLCAVACFLYQVLASVELTTTETKAYKESIMKHISTGSAVFLLLAAGAALAQTPVFDELDVNGDGYVSSSEAEALPCLAANFDRIDSENSKGLNRAEYEAAVDEYCPQNLSAGSASQFDS